MSGKNFLDIIVEDILSEAVMQRLLAKVGYTGGVTFRITHGNGMIRKNMEKYKGASQVIPHIVLIDLDRYSCPLALFHDWSVGALPTSMLLRIAVREAEAWLLADRKGIADFLHAALEKVPSNPELVKDPKQAVFSVIRRSRKRRLVEEMVPQPGAHIGPLYNDRMCEFTLKHWRIDIAAANAPSLRRSLSRISDFVYG
jgi:hypothetical protein